MIVSGTDMGQGFRTAMTQIAAETLGMDIADIYITNGDTRADHPDRRIGFRAADAVRRPGGI